MPEIGSLEILVVAAVAFLVFGPERLPGIARQVGRYASQFRRTLSEVKSEFRMELDDDEDAGKPRSRRPAGGGSAPGDGSTSPGSGGDGTAPEAAGPEAARPEAAGPEASAPTGDTPSGPER